MAFRATNWGPRHPFRSSGSLPAQENQNEAFQPAYGLGNPGEQGEQAEVDREPRDTDDKIPPGFT